MSDKTSKNVPKKQTAKAHGKGGKNEDEDDIIVSDVEYVDPPDDEYKPHERYTLCYICNNNV